MVAEEMHTVDRLVESPLLAQESATWVSSEEDRRSRGDSRPSEVQQRMLQVAAELAAVEPWTQECRQAQKVALNVVQQRLIPSEAAHKPSEARD